MLGDCRILWVIPSQKKRQRGSHKVLFELLKSFLLFLVALHLGFDHDILVVEEVILTLLGDTFFLIGGTSGLLGLLLSQSIGFIASVALSGEINDLLYTSLFENLVDVGVFGNSLLEGEAIVVETDLANVHTVRLLQVRPGRVHDSYGLLLVSLDTVVLHQLHAILHNVLRNVRNALARRHANVNVSARQVIYVEPTSNQSRRIR